MKWSDWVLKFLFQEAEGARSGVWKDVSSDREPKTSRGLRDVPKKRVNSQVACCRTCSRVLFAPFPCCPFARKIIVAVKPVTVSLLWSCGENVQWCQGGNRAPLPDAEILKAAERARKQEPGHNPVFSWLKERALFLIGTLSVPNIRLSFSFPWTRVIKKLEFVFIVR